MAMQKLTEQECKLLVRGLQVLEDQARRAGKANSQIEMVSKGFLQEADLIQLVRLKIANQSVSVG